MSQMSALNISSAPSSGSFGPAQVAAPAPEIVVAKPAKSDAEVVASVASTEIKPSNVAETSAPTRDVVAKAAQQIQSFVSSMGRNLDFSVDSTTGYHIVRVTNPETGEVVRQLPTEELLRIAQSFEQLNAALVHQKA